jgi:hypothetical protein
MPTKCCFIYLLHSNTKFFLIFCLLQKFELRAARPSNRVRAARKSYAKCQPNAASFICSIPIQKFIFYFCLMTEIEHYMILILSKKKIRLVGEGRRARHAAYTSSFFLYSFWLLFSCTSNFRCRRLRCAVLHN